MSLWHLWLFACFYYHFNFVCLLRRYDILLQWEFMCPYLYSFSRPAVFCMHFWLFSFLLIWIFSYFYIYISFDIFWHFLIFASPDFNALRFSPLVYSNSLPSSAWFSIFSHFDSLVYSPNGQFSTVTLFHCVSILSIASAFHQYFLLIITFFLGLNTKFLIYIFLDYFNFNIYFLGRRTNLYWNPILW